MDVTLGCYIGNCKKFCLKCSNFMFERILNLKPHQYKSRACQSAKDPQIMTCYFIYFIRVVWLPCWEVTERTTFLGI